MKKLFLILAILLVLASNAMAAWSVTATWTRSTGPNLDYETILLDAVVQCTVQETENTTCTFIVTELAGQLVALRSFNSQGGYADGPSGTLLAVPAPGTGLILNITQIP